jgi:hypothetical protein
MKAPRDYQMAAGKSIHSKGVPEYKDAYAKEREKWHHETRQSLTKKKVPVDPATVEAELRLEEELWNN